MRAYDEEESLGLTDLAEDSDEEDDPRSPMMGSHNQAATTVNGGANGGAPGAGAGSGTHLAPNVYTTNHRNDTIEMQGGINTPRKSGDRR